MAMHNDFIKSIAIDMIIIVSVLSNDSFICVIVVAVTMIKIVKSYLPTETIIITEHLKNEIKNKVIIDVKTRIITINGYKHTQLYYNSDDIKVYAKILIDRINEHKTHIFME